MKKKILFFEKLDFVSFILILFLKPFYKSIYYRDTNNYFIKDDIKSFLKKFNVNWLSYLDINYRCYHNGITLRRKLEEEFIIDKFKNIEFINKFSKTHNLENKKFEKFKLSLIGTLAENGNIATESTSITLLQKLFSPDEFTIDYYTHPISSYLLLKKNNILKIKVYSIHTLLNFFLLNVQKLILTSLIYIYSFLKKSRDINKNNNNKNAYELSKYQFAYFPHQNLRYSKAYTKTFIYDDDKKSKLYKENVLTLFFNENTELDKRFFRRHKIPTFDVRKLISKRYAINRTLTFFINNFSVTNLVKKINIHDFLLFIFNFRFVFNFYQYENLINKMKNLKAIYVFYDVLFPKTLKLICEIKGIKTISHQARIYQYSYFSPLFYNYYLVSGDFKDLLPKYNYAVDNYINMGIIGANKIKDMKLNYLKKDLINLKVIKETKKIVLCIGLFIGTNHQQGLEGEEGTTLKNNINFITMIYDLSCQFKSLHFIIRLKVYNFFEKIPKEILSKIKKSQNIEINFNLNSLNIYELSNIADFIIGKQTSIMEEALSAGKKVVFYDNENHFKSMDYVLNEVDISEKNYDGLKTRLNSFLSKDYNYLDIFKKQNYDYFSINKRLNSHQIIKDTIKDIIE